MKDYRILTHDQNTPVLISINDYDYPTLLMAGYTVLFEGNRKECECFMELVDSDGALCD